jgi:hypothetical protein
LHQQRGGEQGRDIEDWLEAERRVWTGLRKKNKEGRGRIRNEEKNDRS